MTPSFLEILSGSGVRVKFYVKHISTILSRLGSGLGSPRSLKCAPIASDPLCYKLLAFICNLPHFGSVGRTNVPRAPKDGESPLDCVHALLKKYFGYNLSVLQQRLLSLISASSSLKLLFIFASAECDPGFRRPACNLVVSACLLRVCLRLVSQ